MRVYNMEFGEAILISKVDEKLLIDMGSDKPSNNFKKIWEDIEKQSGTYQLMISHFHDDHVNGLYEKSAKDFGYTLPKAEKIMIPCIFDIKKDDLSYSELEMYRHIFEAVVGKDNRLYTILELLKYAINCSGKIVFLYKGENFAIAGENYSVIWPDKKSDYFSKSKIFENLKNILIDIGIYKEDDGKLDDSYYYRIKGLDEQIASIYRVQSAGQMVGTVETIIAFYDELNEIIDELKSLIGDDKKKQLKEWCKAFINMQNDMSIVFHNQVNDIAKNILFTGDISRGVYDRYVSKEVYGEYRVVKVPHHGTRSSFSLNIPKTNTMIISNGKAKMESKRGKIYEGYGLKYTNTEIICTNPRCCLKDDFGGECTGAHDCHTWKPGEFYIDI